MTQKLVKYLRIIGFAEGCSYLLFAVTMPLKYVYDMPKPNYFVGSAHGFLFLAYIALVLIVSYKMKWKLITTFWALLASLIPFGTFVADKKIFSQLTLAK
ncbi:integral membrane protein [Spirosomataceae bacterium TFI 002]|nr:integral membrane protein [Spirosomataceae bacterium TFI 002]